MRLAQEAAFTFGDYWIGWGPRIVLLLFEQIRSVLVQHGDQDDWGTGMLSCSPTTSRKTPWTSSSGSWRRSGRTTIKFRTYLQIAWSGTEEMEPSSVVSCWRTATECIVLMIIKDLCQSSSSAIGIGRTRAWSSWWEASSTWWVRFQVL